MIKECKEVVIEVWNELCKHKVITIISCIALLALSCVLNAMCIGKTIPFAFWTAMYRPWMAYTEIIGNGLVFGSTIGYVSMKK